MTQRLTDALLERGLYTRVAMDCICLAPPLVTTDAQSTASSTRSTTRSCTSSRAVKKDLSVPALSACAGPRIAARRSPSTSHHIVHHASDIVRGRNCPRC